MHTVLFVLLRYCVARICWCTFRLVHTCECTHCTTSHIVLRHTVYYITNCTAAQIVLHHMWYYITHFTTTQIVLHHILHCITERTTSQIVLQLRVNYIYHEITHGITHTHTPLSLSLSLSLSLLNISNRNIMIALSPPPPSTVFSSLSLSLSLYFFLSLFTSLRLAFAHDVSSRCLLKQHGRVGCVFLSLTHTHTHFLSLSHTHTLTHTPGNTTRTTRLNAAWAGGVCRQSAGSSLPLFACTSRLHCRAKTDCRREKG